MALDDVARRRRAAIVAAVMAITTTACSGGTASSPTSPSSPSSPTTPTSTTGRLLVRLSAGSFAPAKAILVTFSRVRVFRGSPTNFTDVPLSGGSSLITCDLKKLTSDAEIAVGVIPAAAYSQVTLGVQSMTVYIDNPTATSPCAASIPPPGGRSAPLSVPSEIAIPHNFDVKAAADTIMRLDFNTEQSIRVTGENSFSLNPLFTVASVTSSS